MADHIEDHSKLYKNAGKGEQDLSRRRRTEQTIELRRQKRGNVLNKRRNIDPNAEYESESTDVEKAPPPKLNCTLPEAKELLMNNPTLETLRNVFETIRRMLSRDKNPPIDEVVNEGLVVALVQALGVSDRKVQYEAAWALTNVVSGTTRHTQAAVDAGATVALINLAGSTDDQGLVDQCVWAVANIMGEGAMFRNHAIDCGILNLLSKFVENIDKLELNLVKTLAWVCSNISRHKTPQITLDQVKIVLPVIQALLKYDDNDVRQDAGWSLSYLTDSSDEILNLVLQSSILQDVQNCLKSGNDKVIAPSLRVVGNFVSGTDDLTQAIIDTGILTTVIPKILDKNNSSVTKEACWVLSNILAGTPEQVQAVVDAKLIPKIIRCMNEGDFKAMEEAAWALSNLCHSGNHIQIFEMAKYRVLSAAASHLSLRKVEFIKNLLLVVEATLNSISTMQPSMLEHYKFEFEEAGGIDFVEDLQNHDNSEIYEYAYRIINNYFTEEEDEPLDTSANMSSEQPVFHF